MAPESLYQGVYTTKSDVWVMSFPAPWQRNYWNVSTESLLKIVVAAKITEVYNSEAPKFSLFVYNHARVGF